MSPFRYSDDIWVAEFEVGNREMVVELDNKGIWKETELGLEIDDNVIKVGLLKIDLELHFCIFWTRDTSHCQ